MSEALFAPSEYAALFFDLFENSSDAVILTRLEDGLIFDANDSFLSLFGLAREKAVGRTTSELGIWVHPEDRSAYVEELLAKRKVKRKSVRFRSRWSEEFTLELSATLVRFRDEEAILAVGTLARTR